MNSSKSDNVVSDNQTPMMILDDIFVKPDFDNSKIEVTFTKPDEYFALNYEITDDNGVVTTGTQKMVSSQVRFEIDVPNFVPWSVDNPHLYTLKIEFDKNGTKPFVTQRFGMIKIQTENRKIHFNNNPLYLRGFIRGRKGHEHENYLPCSAKDFYKKNIMMAKSFGFNFIRWHSVVPSEDFLQAADELGMLCQIEIRKYYGKYQKQRAATGFGEDQTLVDEQEWATMILRLRNHPCVLVYGMGNEINHPGSNERVSIIRNLTKKLDPTRLFLDSTSRGEFDRDTVDIDVQHMSYFAPFGKHHNMFDDSIHLAIYGSVTGKKMSILDNEDNPNFVMRREVQLKFPLIAHEVCHYVALRDPYELDKKFEKFGGKKPWWVGELTKMIEGKGHKDQYDKMLVASQKFQKMWMKQGLESARKSPILEGFHFLQFSDSDDYENSNGLVDCFDDEKYITPEEFSSWNSASVIVADLPRRSFVVNEQIEIPICVSHYPEGDFDSWKFSWSLEDGDGKVYLSAQMDDFDLSSHGLIKLCRIELKLPDLEKPKQLKFKCRLESDDQRFNTENSWEMWVFPNKAERIPSISLTADLKDINLYRRYSQLEVKKDTKNTENILITDHFDENVINHLRQGKDALILYRVDENRNRKAPREKYYMPSTWERFKGVIWDRGHNCGGFTREHQILKDFPQDGFVNWQFYHLIEDGDKVNLDDFPVKVVPIIEGIDKAVRDRFDVGRFDLSEFQYEYTMRKFAYLFELQVGKGRCIISGLNFKGIETDEPAVCYLFENIINYMLSKDFSPKEKIDVDHFEKYLITKGSAKRIKERMMTQYWQLDDAPLESKKYWNESEESLRED